MPISSISSSHESCFIPAHMTKEKINNCLEEAMIHLDFDQMIELLNQGANPQTTTIMTPSLAEKMLKCALEKTYSREYEIDQLFRKTEKECSTVELAIIKALKSDPESISDDEIKNYLSSKCVTHCGIVTLRQIASSCLNDALMQKLDKLDLRR